MTTLNIGQAVFQDPILFLASHRPPSSALRLGYLDLVVFAFSCK